MSSAWDVVADALGFGGPSGTDHGSSNWAAWGHPEIRSMLDASVDPDDIGAASSAWREQGRNTTNVLTGLTRDLSGAVTDGWRGAAADAALGALDPINQWTASQAEIAERTTALMDSCGCSAGRAKATVPPPRTHDWGESLGTLAVGGVPGAVVDAVAQEQRQSQAHAEAVRIMTTVYSAPIKEYRAAVPTYSQLTDPTRQTLEQPPESGLAPDLAGYPAGESPGGGAPASGAATLVGGHVAHSPAAPIAHQPAVPIGHPSSASMPHPQSASTAHPLGDPTAYPQPAPTALQNVTSGAPAASAQGTAGFPQAGGQVAEAASVPAMGQIAGEARPARGASGGIRLGGGGYPGSGGWGGASHSAEFGPRPSAVAGEGPLAVNSGRGATSVGAGRADPGGMLAPMGGGRGPGGEDSEHRRPSYLIELDDVFADGRKVAPAVIGEDPPERER
ncbi:MAG: PPE domain-containing protein [Pseudonocardiaceae bacterium]